MRFQRIERLCTRIVQQPRPGQGDAKAWMMSGSHLQLHFTDQGAQQRGGTLGHLLWIILLCMNADFPESLWSISTCLHLRRRCFQFVYAGGGQVPIPVKPDVSNVARWDAGTVIGVLVDCECGKLSFTFNGRWTGEIFDNMYSGMCLVWGLVAAACRCAQRNAVRALLD